MKKLSGWKTKGMNQDMSVSAFSSEFAFENMNLRLSTNEGNTTFSWVNERGTAPIYTLSPEYWSKDEDIVYINPQDDTWEYHEGDSTIIKGICIGTAVLNEYLVLFITSGGEDGTKDCIYRLQHRIQDIFDIVLLYEGNLNFSPEYPLETIVSYEATDIQKVYWTDGINQPRLINIVSDNIRKSLDTQFDFIPTLQLDETIHVTKVTGGGGIFAPGVIQYAFTYYYKHGQESNIFYVTPLTYISHVDRGASPEDKVDNVFNIKIQGIDINFDFLRIYSIQRTSINSTPLCKRVQDIAIEGTVRSKRQASYIDTGTNGDSIDPTELLFKGGNIVNVGTIEQKDNTLFMGKITTPNITLPNIKPEKDTDPKISLEVGKRSFYPLMISTDNYEYASQLTSVKAAEEGGIYTKTDESVPCAGFKYGDFYRCGVQFQDTTGKWSDPVFIDDIEIKKPDEEPVEPEEVQEETRDGESEESEEPTEPLHAPYIITNMKEESVYDGQVNITVVNNSANPITITPEAYIVITVLAPSANETPVEQETRSAEVVGRVGDEAKILMVTLGEFTRQEIAVEGSQTFNSALIRDSKQHYMAPFCTDLALLESVEMSANCALVDVNGNYSTLVMSNVTWSGAGDPRLPKNDTEQCSYTFTCTASPVPPTPPGPGPEPPSGDLGEFLYKVALVSDLHLCATNDEETPSKASDDWHDEDDFRAVMNVVLNDTGIKFVAGCGDAIESEAPNMGTPEKDSDSFWDIYSPSYWQQGIRLFTCLGNHDFWGMYESRLGDTIIEGQSNYLSLEGYNTSVKSRIGSIWYDGDGKGIQGYGVNGVNPNTCRMTFDMNGTPSHQYDIHYFAFNSFTETYYDEYSQGGLIPPPGDPILPETLQAATAYINANWSTLKNKIGGWDQGSNGMRSGYSKESYWIKKNDDIYVFMSVDYGNDVWGLNDQYHGRMSRARTVIDVTSTDIYIKRMMEYVNGSGYTESDVPYNYQYYSPNALIWLKELIEDNPGKKIYVFSHHFLPHRVGNGDIAIDGLPKDGASSYADIHPNGDTDGEINRGSNVLTGVEFWFLNKLINSHQNVIWFTGHSHLSWECKDTIISEENRIADHFTNRDYDIVSPSASNTKAKYTRDSNTPKSGYGGWCVALPSMSKPIVMDRNYYDSVHLRNGSIQKDGDAEMAIMHVYENGVIIKGYKVRENNVNVFNENNPLVEQTIILRSSASNSSESRMLLRSAGTPSEPARSLTSTVFTQTIKNVLVTVPVIKGNIPADIAENLIEQGYVKARAVVVYPDMQSRKVLCQGVATPTVYTTNHRSKYNMSDSMGDLYAQASWFFRPKTDDPYTQTVNTPLSTDDANIEYINNANSNLTEDVANPQYIKRVEIQGHYNSGNKFKVDWETLTFHSPDVEFDTNMANLDYSSNSLQYSIIGSASFLRTFSDIDIQTETPTISSEGAGFIKKSFTGNRAMGIISGLFWDDYEVDDGTIYGIEEDTIGFGPYTYQTAPSKWMVYLWNKNGSLNNDITRPANAGIASAILKRKIVSNLRFANTDWITSAALSDELKYKSSLFFSDQPEILKLDVGTTSKANVYMGNIDTLLLPDEADGMYFSINASKVIKVIGGSVKEIYGFSATEFNSEVDKKTFGYKDGETKAITDPGNYQYTGNSWNKYDENLGNEYFDIVLKKDPVRMKYKSTPHIVMLQSAGSSVYDSIDNNTLPVYELQRDIVTDPTSPQYTLFGGLSDDAMRALTWIPCGEPVKLWNGAVDGEGRPAYKKIDYEYSWGDTYYQRWDCLKTYAFTPEDINQVVEIGSFMLETRMNIDGRYDRNRGQLSNLYMSPRNFNLINPVYSQQNNFFTYRTLDEDNYKRKKYDNQITWSLKKTSGADVDLWTQVTLAAVEELDGDKGSINKLVRFNDQLLAFQDRGLAQIMYNENVQISASQGVAIELANSGKVQGKRYISDSIGCINKWSVASTPAGIYFMDSIDKNIYIFNGQLSNLSSSMGMNSWVKKAIPTTTVKWTPYSYTNNNVKMEGFGNFVAYNDRQNDDVYFINRDTALAFSEKLSAFTSFYDYGNTPYFCNFDDGGIWVKNCTEELTEKPFVALFEHQKGEYCNFFGQNKPYWMTLVGNPEPQTDKIFTNLEFRASVDGDGELQKQVGKFSFTLPFDFLETWDEYQHGYTALSERDGHSAMMHYTNDNVSSLKRKFRMWRCDIPRNNCLLDADRISGTPYSTDAELNISRHIRKPSDRMRNSWLYLKLKKQGDTSNRTEIHDLLMTYFN